jgi:hypothetical protein
MGKQDDKALREAERRYREGVEADKKRQQEDEEARGGSGEGSNDR